MPRNLLNPTIVSKAEKLTELARRRGFFWPALELYGGVSGFVSFGELGVKLKEKIIRLWRDYFVHSHGFTEVDTPLISPYTVFEVSGHVESFKDPMAECSKCHRKFRADHLLMEFGRHIPESMSIEDMKKELNKGDVKCKECSNAKWDVGHFLTMFRTTIGPYSENEGFIRPETAQGMFTEFKRLYEVSRGKMPLGVAQIGKAFRNEISPRQGIIRLREFSMMEVEFFFDPSHPACPLLDQLEDEELRILPEETVTKGIEEPLVMTVKEALNKGAIKQEWLAYFMVLSKKFLRKLGIPEDRQRFYEKLPGERAHYSAQTYDHEVLLDKFGWVEVAGHAYRTDYDLSSHMKKSSIDLSVSVQLKEPIKVKHLKMNIDAKKVWKTFQDKTGGILKRLHEMSPEDVKREMEDRGEVVVEGYRLPMNAVEFVEVEEETKVRRFIPHVVEPSFGIERLIYATLEYAYWEKEERRVILRILPRLAPIQVAVFPLVSKKRLQKRSLAVLEDLRRRGIDVIYDDSGSIGRRYARADEIGVPFSITIDYQTLDDDTLTVRDRDTWKQKRIPVKDLPEYLIELLHYNCSLYESKERHR
ncbi:MAG: glycine--tRNA ligase [Candidatus Methylarchaceae archaeon HK02M1]|nr:glycine--tRNA ligase [Candidatus Methylarchaceae archaeon HK02M1]